MCFLFSSYLHYLALFIIVRCTSRIVWSKHCYVWYKCKCSHHHWWHRIISLGEWNSCKISYVTCMLFSTWYARNYGGKVEMICMISYTYHFNFEQDFCFNLLCICTIYLSDFLFTSIGNTRWTSKEVCCCQGILSASFLVFYLLWFNYSAWTMFVLCLWLSLICDSSYLIYACDVFIFCLSDICLCTIIFDLCLWTYALYCICASDNQTNEDLACVVH